MSSKPQSDTAIEVETLRADGIVKMFLLQNEPIFGRLCELREKVSLLSEYIVLIVNNQRSQGWANPEGDTFFKQQRSRADNTNRGGALIFFNMMRSIGDELQAKTNAIVQSSESGEEIKILDLCMAPGGYTDCALKYNPTATACGITLPPAKGGHELLLLSSRSKVSYLDITMLVGEMGVRLDEVPPTHPDYARFLTERPYIEETFHLVFCDGQVLRCHQRAEYREPNEALRLTVSQLVLALQRIRPGGTLVILLHKLEAWDTAQLIYQFRQFSSVALFKPEKKHAIRSSFYLVARNVQPENASAKEAVEGWKRAWRNATFGGQNGTGQEKVMPDAAHVRALLSDFGKDLIQLGQPIWETQANALSKADFVK